MVDKFIFILPGSLTHFYVFYDNPFDTSSLWVNGVLFIRHAISQSALVNTNATQGVVSTPEDKWSGSIRDNTAGDSRFFPARIFIW